MTEHRHAEPAPPAGVLYTCDVYGCGGLVVALCIKDGAAAAFCSGHLDKVSA